MNIFRLAKSADIEGLAALTASVGAGLTTVPRTPEKIAAYIDETERFLKGDETANRLFFVVEMDGKVVGMSAILPRLGRERPYCSFKISRHSRHSTNPELKTAHDSLQFSTEFDGNTALATLFLSKDVRGGGVGRLLSLGRLAFIDQHRDLFSQTLMADIRGWLDENGEAPFWNFIASKFINLPFKEADELSSEDGRFIAELIPSLPILLSLLPPETQDYIGRPHKLSSKAMALLMNAGFKQTDLCDVFDGGPAIKCDVSDTSIARTAVRTQTLADDVDGDYAMLFTGHKHDFKATITKADIRNAVAPEKVASSFELEDKSKLWIAATRHTDRLADQLK
ncbi:arginine N-succinyltransferase [Hirschia maritima]|uniref:arginine N-succinyltransferase n=1 Tax=Hirschia maritima TaxID=1121961 RepID=UPI00037B31D9|nr:arginine N-succinyltransferase [Hirschia maritima]